MRKVKLFWDFRGPSADKTAAHYLIHLNEFLTVDGYLHTTSAVECINTNFYSVFLICFEPDAFKIKAALKPHRGELVNT